ncbi:MAG: 1-aminocyclopropane-1-carboxylate deaminase [Flavobacteriales bacterium]|nr:1-aminocyclopropane-1-carboxylate deaminase [Flavobacteriales bacterium]
MLNLNIPTSITKINSDFLQKKSIKVFIKRDDLIHDVISGNKWRKLKYNLIEANLRGHDNILSFGGAYSNHLHALSYACNKMSLKSIGVIRGEKKTNLNSTLSFCQNNNMSLYYVSRSDYRDHKYSKDLMQDLQNTFGDYYIIPEGGCNLLGAKGCSEILEEIDFDFDFVCCAVGTGCTASGLINSMKPHQYLLGFCPFKKVFEQKQNILQFSNLKPSSNWKLIPDTDFGGFGKINVNLSNFIREFNLEYNVKLDLVYMGKLFYYLFHLIKNDFFNKHTRILVLHSGGLQGLSGFNFKY